MTVPVKGRRVWCVTGDGVTSAVLKTELQDAYVRAQRKGSPPEINDGEDESLVAVTSARLSQRIVQIMTTDTPPPSWLLVVDPRVRAAVNTDDRTVTWRKAPI